jgi:hypothetical protein
MKRQSVRRGAMGLDATPGTAQKEKSCGLRCGQHHHYREQVREIEEDKG